jgi:type III secretion system FlhB-like substrate exporter
MHNRFEFAYMEKQIADTVMKIAKDNACILEEQSEVPASLTERDIKSYLNEVIAEVVKLAKTKSTGDLP